MENTIAIRRQTFTAADIALFAVWLLACATLGRTNEFMGCVLAGGAIMIAREAYGRLALGEANQGLIAIAAATPIFLVVSGLSLSSVVHATPVTFDAQLARLDLGIAPAVRSWCQARTWAICPLEAAYGALPLAVMIGATLAAKSDRKRMLLAAAIGGVLVVPWYLILPAVGPAHVGQPYAPRNCMPSMHVTWAAVTWTNSRGATRLFAGAFVAITVLATLATGEHYTPDLVAALPWTWTLNQLAGKAK